MLGGIERSISLTPEKIAFNHCASSKGAARFPG
jgi:hypothetical protein